MCFLAGSSVSSGFFFIVHFILFNIEKPQSDSTKEAEEPSPEFKQQEEGKYKMHGLLLYLHVRVVFVFSLDGGWDGGVKIYQCLFGMQTVRRG